MLKRYPLDSTGRSTDNLVDTERHILTTEGNDIIFPRYGAYFNDSMVVKQGEKTLAFNKDYQLSFFWQDATIKVGKPISVALQILNNNLIGEIQLTYQVVGGEYQGTLEAIESIKDFIPNMHRNIFWDDVINKPEAWVPTRHLHQINDVFGLTSLVLVLEELRRSIENQSVLKLKSVYDRFLKLKQYVETNIAENVSVKRDLNRILSQVDERTQGIVKRSDIDTLFQSVKNDIINDVANQFTQRIIDLETTKSIVSRDIARLTQELLDVVESTNNLTTRLNEMNSKITDVENRFVNKSTSMDSKITRGLENANQAIANLSSTINNVQQTANNVLNTAKEDLIHRIDEAIATERNTFEAKLSQLSTDINSNTNQSIDIINTKIEQEIGQRKTSILELNANFEKYKETIVAKNVEQDNRSSQIENRVTSLEEKDRALSEKIETNAETIKINFDNTVKRVDAIEQRYNALSVSNIDGLPDAISTRVSQIVSEAESRLNTSVSAQKSVIDESIQTIEQRITGANGILATMQEKVKMNSDELLRVEEHFSRIEKTAQDASIKDTEHDASIKNLTRRIGSLETANSSGIPADVQRKLDELKENLEDKFTEEQANIERRITKVKSDLEAGMSISNGLETRLQNIEQLNQTQTTDISNVKEAIGSFNTKIKEEVVKFSTEDLEAKIKTALDKRIAEEKVKTPDLALEKLNLHPDTPTETQIGTGRYTISTIVHMDTSEDKGKRVPFAPTTQYEWTASSNWLIPNEYDGLIAQVYLTTNLKWQNRPDSDNPNGTVISPSTLMGYVRLKAGLTVQITVGDITSFGTYLTNDGSSDLNLVTPSMVMSGIAYPQESIGKYGKVLLIV